MVENLIRRAKQFIGLEEGEEVASGKQLEMGTFFQKEKSGDKEYEVVVFSPKVYEDSLNISTYLRRGCPVIINLKHLEPTEGTRLIDFVCGTAYAIDGHMMKIGDSIFLFAPNSIDITDAEERASLGEELRMDDKKESFFRR